MTSSTSIPRTPGQAAGAHGVDAASLHGAQPGRNRLATHPEAATSNAPRDTHLTIEVEDWDVLFEAVKTTLRRTVGERLNDPPEVPEHSAALAASLVQSVVLDCVSSLDRLHIALKQERGQQ